MTDTGATDALARAIVDGWPYEKDVGADSRLAHKSARGVADALAALGYEIRPIPVDGICDIVVSFHPKDGGHPCDNWRPIAQAAEAADREAAAGEDAPSRGMTTPEKGPSAAADSLDDFADCVRYGGGNGPESDYWRGFNDGIDALVAAYAAAKEAKG